MFAEYSIIGAAVVGLLYWLSRKRSKWSFECKAKGKIGDD
jgi:hypothetical protein